MANVLLVDANFSSAPQLAALRRAGHMVWICGAYPEAYLARSDPFYLEFNYADTNILRSAVERLCIDFIVPGCTDMSYFSCSQLNTDSRFPGIDDWHITQTLNNKQQFRSLCAREGLSAPRLIPAGEAPSGPVIVKPADAFSGMGITVLNSSEPNALQAAIEHAHTASPNKSIVIEEFVEGDLHSYSAFLHKGRVTHAFVVAEHCFTHPYVVDTSYLVYDLASHVTDALRAEVEHLAYCLRLKDGLLHGQFIRTQDSFVWVEMTRRCPGDLYSQLIELSTGFPYAACYAQSFLGQPLQTIPNTIQRCNILRHTVTQAHDFAFDYVEFHAPMNVRRWVPLASQGQALEASPKGRVGILFAQAKNPRELNNWMQRAALGQLVHISELQS